MRVRAARGRGRSGEAGLSSLELLGIVTTAVILVAALLVVGNRHYPEAISEAFCRLTAVVSGDPASCSSTVAEAADEQEQPDFQPGVCMLSETKDKKSWAVTLGSFKMGHEYGFIVQQFADGSVRATMTDGAGLEANAKVASKTFDTKKLGDGDKVKTEIKLGGGLTFEYGSTWEFDTLDEFDTMREQLDAYVEEQHQLNSGFYPYMLERFWLELTDGYVDPPKDPTISYYKVGLEGALKGAHGIHVPGFRTDKNGQRELIDPKMGATGALTAGGSVLVKEDATTGSVSYTFELSGKGAPGGGAVLGQVTGEGGVSGAFTTKYDKKGQLVEIGLKSAYDVGVTGTAGNDTFKIASGKMSEGQRRSVVTNTTLAVTDDNRDVVTAWVRDHATERTLQLPFSAFVPDAPSDDPFQQLMYEQAKVSQTSYDNVKDTKGFGMAVKKGWELGFNIGDEESTASMVNSSFLGAPGKDGTRQLVADEKCARG